MSAAASPEAAEPAQQHPEAGKREANSKSAPLAREIKAPSQTPRPPRAARTSKETISLQGKIGNTEMTETQVNLHGSSCCFRCFKLVQSPNQHVLFQEKWMRTEWQTSWAKKASRRPESFRFEPQRPELSVRTSPAPYYTVPFVVWHPCRLFPLDVPHMPCPGPKPQSDDALASSEDAAAAVISGSAESKDAGSSQLKPCMLRTTLKSFNSPRWVIGVSSCELLWSSAHHCPEHGVFSSTDEKSMARLPTFVQNMFPFVCSSRTAITRE